MTPELLAPAGSPEALHAAVQNGADAVYLGWSDFNARQSAKNFSDEAFEEALLYCHRLGVRVYLTLNTLVTDRELPAALEVARKACRCGIDAVLVQDWGLFELLKTSLPDLPLHASTQMSIFTSGGACTAAALGLKRIVLARECSREEIAAICKRCPAEIEVFVHGALCMCYSGQCAMSALIGGRSGNRGRCAQPCRLPYGVDGPPAGQHPLSLKDQCLASELAALEEMGVACLKLEGRMKRPEYVAVVTSIYARLLRERRPPSSQERRDLDAAFSRSGFTDGYWRGHTGPEMFGVRPERMPEPKKLYEKARATYEKDSLRTVSVSFDCRIQEGVPCALTLQDEDSGIQVALLGPVPEPARNRELTEAMLEQRLCKTGGTGYTCTQVNSSIEPGLSLSASLVNELRRCALAALTEARTVVPARREQEAEPLPDIDCSAETPAFTVSITRLDQLTPALLRCHPVRVYVPLELFADIDALPSGDWEWCASLPRVWRDWDEPVLSRLLDQAMAMGVTGALIGNLGHLSWTERTGLLRYGDFGFNVYNTRTLAFLRKLGLSSACVSFELRGAQIRDLKKLLPLEAIVYGRLPLMVTEHCLIRNHDPGCPCHREHWLTDRTGAQFPLLPVFGHRTEIENSRTLYLGDRPEYRRMGLQYARLRFTTETPEECVRIFQSYRNEKPPVGAFTRGLFDRGVK